jgi:hypothetical protein
MCSNIDYDALRGGAGGDPPDGTHEAQLVRAKLVDTEKGTRLVTEWQTTGATPYYWATWFGFDGARLGFAQEFLDAIGADRSQITDDEAFEAALEGLAYQTYVVRTAAWSGGVNTYITEARDVAPDVPIAEVEPVAVAAADNAIPFHHEPFAVER